MARTWLVVVCVVLAGCDRLFNLEHVDNVVRRDAPNDGTSAACAPRSVATGRGHSCSVDQAGHVYCWGSNQQGQVTPSSVADRVLQPTEVVLPKPATQVTAGRGVSCALLDDQSIWCWGQNSSGVLGVTPNALLFGPIQVPGVPPAAEVGAGGYHVCMRAALDGAVWCWGGNDDKETGQTTGDIACNTNHKCSLPSVVPGTTGTLALDLGHRHTCVVNATGHVACWGRNHRSQLGDNGPSRAVPTVLATLGPSADVSAAGTTSCAIDLGGTVRCWGEGEDGQLGNGMFASSMSPTSTSITNATAISVGGFGSCALLEGGGVTCWGELDAGDGVGATTNAPHLSLVTGATQIAANFFHTCAIANNDVACWGSDSDGQLGRGDRAVVLSPQLVSVPGPVTQIAVGSSHVCALGMSQQVYCWGSNDYGEGTDSQLRPFLVPTRIDPSLTGVTRIVAAYDHTCALNDAGAATCWGFAASGSLGTGVATRHVATPAPVLTSNIAQIALGSQHMCTRDSGGTVRCFGLNSSGQLGTASPSSSTGGVTALTGATEVAAGERFSCALVSARVACWGDNGAGQLGDGTTMSRATPGPITLASTNFDKIGAGRQHACAREVATGDIYCWGTNRGGELGIGTRTSPVLTPQRVILPGSATELWVGYGGACAKLQSGAVYCWGDSEHGQTGTGQQDDVLTPIAVASVTGATAVGASFDGICFLSGGEVSCSGAYRLLANNDNSRSRPMRPALPTCE